MYDVLCHLGDLFFQGLFTSLFVLFVARWYEQQATKRKALTAAIFISIELQLHVTVLAYVVEDKAMLKDKPLQQLGTSHWDDFRRDLATLMEPKSLYDLATYYASAKYYESLLHTENLSPEESKTLKKYLEYAREMIQLVDAFSLSLPPASCQGHFGVLKRLKDFF